MTLAVRAVSKHFPDRDGAPRPVLAEVSFTVGPGEVVAVVGPNGAGKTTLLRIIAGIDESDGGEVTLPAAAPGSSAARSAPATALVFQDYAESLLPWRRNLDNLTLALEVQGMGRAARRALARRRLREWRLDEPGADLLVQLGIPEDGYSYQLSGGQRQWLAVLRAFLAGPRVILLDEPFAALDPDHRAGAQERLVALHARAPLATLLVSHDLDEALYLADRVVVLSRRPGRVVATVAIDLPRPRQRRDGGAVDPAAAALRRRLGDALAEAHG